MTACPFCAPTSTAVFHEGETVIGLWDAFPVCDGHALVVTRRHVESWFDATDAERIELASATLAAKAAIQRRTKTDAFNIGVNVGEAAGQTVRHLHVHIIPRTTGDVPDPRGGVRHVIPGKGNYLVGAADASGAPNAPEVPQLLSTGEHLPLMPLLARDLKGAQQLDIAVAFILKSGVDRVYEHVAELLARSGTLRLVAGDYLDITDPDALRELMDLALSYPDARVDLRMFEARERSFHPKAYIVTRPDGSGAAYVGSSNLSKSALEDGVEWNYRVITSRDREGFSQVRAAFERVFSHDATVPLDDTWLAAYRRRRRTRVDVPAVDVVAEPPEPPPEPNAVQQEALNALRCTRQDGFTAGLVVMATGLGKTWLAAFDTNEAQFRKVLFVAHRQEILAQAVKTFRRTRPRARFGYYNGTERALDAEVVFASIQTLGKKRHLTQFDPSFFDYIVVDEFHHADASTYRRLIGHFRPRFLLGLTATPERTDGGDLLALCQENLVYRREMGDGIRLGLLSPFEYFGVPDEVDFRNIPWKNAKFDEDALTTAVATRERAANALEQWRKHGRGRTLAFCVSQRHADFMRGFFVQRGIKALAVHSGPTSDPRVRSMELLAAGEVEVVFAVDIFNEGVDIPQIETVLMLRPTESQIVWLQQFGRGLRKVDGKRLKVIDYIGNHRVFLVKVRSLLQLGAASKSEIAAALAKVERKEWDLPAGCEITYELRTLEILRDLLRGPGQLNALREYYVDYRERLGSRPTAVEAFHDQYSPRSMHASHGSWVEFVRAMGDLDEEQSKALEAARDTLRAFETTPMSKSYKMLVAQALLDAAALPGRGLSINELVSRVRDIAARNPRLKADLGGALSSDRALRVLLESNPVDAWIKGKGTGGVPQFDYRDAWFRCTANVPDDLREAAAGLFQEVVDWRLAEYLSRPGASQMPGSFTMSVSHTKGRPMLFLPSGGDRAKHPEVPEGRTRVIANGEPYVADFVKVAVNVLRKTEDGDNELPSILRGWFGWDAGLAGTSHEVVAEPTTDRALIFRPLEGWRPPVLERWATYAREQIPLMFDDRFSDAIWNVGFVVRPTESPKHLFVLATLDKKHMVESHKYEDGFISPVVFGWSSQNRNSREDDRGQLIRDHAARGVQVHLFVRAGKRVAQGAPAPFIYCGAATFDSWSGDNPIKIRWKLQEPVPERLRDQLGVPRG